MLKIIAIIVESELRKNNNSKKLKQSIKKRGRKMEYKFTQQNFNDEVMNSNVPVLIDFYADWCMPCKMMGSAVKKLADEYEGKAKVGKVNVDEQPELASQFGVRSIPFFAIMKDGKMVDNALGAMPKAALENKLKKVL